MFGIIVTTQSLKRYEEQIMIHLSTPRRRKHEALHVRIAYYRRKELAEVAPEFSILKKTTKNAALKNVSFTPHEKWSTMLLVKHQTKQNKCHMSDAACDIFTLAYSEQATHKTPLALMIINACVVISNHTFLDHPSSQIDSRAPVTTAFPVFLTSSMFHLLPTSSNIFHVETSNSHVKLHCSGHCPRSRGKVAATIGWRGAECVDRSCFLASGWPMMTWQLQSLGQVWYEVWWASFFYDIVQLPS